MEWVEFTGPTIEAAKDAALDRLGVDMEDAEFEILEEPSKGLFGRSKGQARVRARIRPTAPRPKLDRRDRRPKRSGGRSKGGQRSTESAAAAPAAAPREESESSSGSSRGRREGGRRTDRPAAGEKSRQTAAAAEQKEVPAMTETVDVDLVEHTRIVTEFLDGLVDAFELEGRVQMTEIDEETNEVHIEGRDLGVLVGPRGATLAAIQELSRTVVHRKVSGTAAGRVRLDVAGYRARRREALERFTLELAEEVRTSGVAKALEPMGSADRKVVHDTVNDLDGVATVSEGEEPRRRVVIVPA
ncbi:MAG: KH domain-containing protein [Acidimicrobiia bacterium]|nr:KH domain-containing protein [Acidimicrobiia bacterium]